MTVEQNPGHALPHSTPEAQGISSEAVLAFVGAAEQEELGLHSLMLLRHGHVCAEGWWSPYRPSDPHMLFSLSKSFTATAAGLVIDQGKLSLDDPVISFFPDKVPEEVSANLAAMRVRNLLSMSTGHDKDTTGRLRDSGDGDWVRAFLAQPVEHAPGTHFVYNSGATFMVSAIVQKITGQTVLDFLRPRLFDPLGIAHPTWETSPQGISVGGWGLSITTEDIARFGQLYLQNGIWQGRRLLPEAWVAEATAKQVSNGSDPDSDWAQGYGFQFWRCRHDAYRGDGAFGQFCVVLPEQDAVIAMTAGSGNLGGVLNAVWTHLLPAMTAAPLPDNPAARTRLTDRLGALSLAAPSGGNRSPVMAQVSGQTYTFLPDEGDDTKLEAVVWEFDDGGGAVTVRDGQGTHRIEAGADTWRRGRSTLGGSEERAVAARGAWTAEDTYTLQAYFTETPFGVTLTGRFSGDRVQLDRRQNVSFGPAARPPREGRKRSA